jgi:O-antigen/teichoic acid export membrane protein
VVAGSTNTTQVGFYALAFSLAYAPLSQVSWTVGSVLLPAVASTQDRAAVREQALKATRLMALLLLPLLPASIALAPGLIPTLLGEKWAAAVVPFQILILVGVGQGILNMLGEVFAGAGGRSLYRRAYTDVVWAVATLAAIAVGVQVAGIRGAAAAHVITFSCLAAAYVWWVSRTIGITPGQIGAELRQIAACVLVQAAVTAALVGVFRAAGASSLTAGIAGAAGGVLALALMLRAVAPGVVREGRSAVAAAIGRRRAAATVTA